MTQIHGFDYFQLHYGNDGNPANADELAALKQHLGGASAPTDLIFIAHGFRNDENDATGLYSDFLASFRGDLGRPGFAQSLAGRKWAVAGVLWPSKKFSEGKSNDGGGSVQSLGDSAVERAQAEAELRDLRDNGGITDEQKAKIDRAITLLDQIEGNPAVQDEFVSLVLSVTSTASADPLEGLDRVKARPGSEVLDVLKAPVILPTTVDDGTSDGGAAGLDDSAFPVASDDGSAQGLGNFFGSVLGAAGKLANLTTWYVMKDRSGAVGANGVAPAVRDLRAAFPNLKIHLVGHSLGGRLMASCAKTLASDPRLQPDSLTLLEAAFSHYGFSTQNGDRAEGFFRQVIAPASIVKGPLIATFSSKDTVVGYAYAITSRLASDNTRAIGDKNDQYGGIGRNGAQQCDVALEMALNQAGQAYGAPFPLNKVVCLDGSAGLINNHSDITNPNVTWAFANSLALT